MVQPFPFVLKYRSVNGPVSIGICITTIIFIFRAN